MRVNKETVQVTARGDSRITAIGRLLRLLKVDELPGLWNVVRGDMGLVGYRPEVPRYVDLANPLWREALKRRPGITDPVTLRLRNEEQLMAQVPGDHEQFYLETLQPYKLVSYLEYLRSRSILTDLTVIVRTLAAVITPAYSPPPPIEEIRRVVSAAGIRKTKEG